MDLSRRSFLGAAGLSGLALLAGCTRPVPGPEPTPTLTQAPVAVGGINERPADQLVQGGALRQPLSAWPESWHPWRGNADALAVRAALTAPAFHRDASGAARPNPDVIASATAAGTPTVVTLALNPKAVWGDGAPVTAGDWIATWKAFGTEGVRAPSGWDRIASVQQGADDRTVVVTFSGVDPDWAEPLAAGCARAPSLAPQASDGWRTLNPAWFAGPYTIAALQPRQGLVTLQPNPRWWGSTPRLDEVFFRVVPDELRAATFAAGEFDTYPLSPSDPRRSVARSASNTTVLTAPGTQGRLATFAAGGLWGDAALRQALIRALDRGQLARELAAVWGVTPVVWNNHLLLPSQPGYMDAAEASGWRFDAAAAQRLFEEAGWTRTGDNLQRAGRRLTLTVTASPDDVLATAEAAALTAVLRERGIAVATVPSGGDLSVKTVAVPVAPLRGAAGRVPSFPGSARLFAQLDTTWDAAARASLAARAAIVAWQSGASLPLYVAPESVVVRSRLANLGASGYATVDWAKVGWTS